MTEKYEKHYTPNLSLSFVVFRCFLIFFFQDTNLFAISIVHLQVSFKTAHKNITNSQQKPHKQKAISQIISRANTKERPRTFKIEKT